MGFQLRISRWEKMSRHLPGRTGAAATSLAAEHTAVAPHRQTVNDQKARLTLGVIMGTFLLCWLPFFVVNIIRPAAPMVIHKNLILAVTWLGYANSAANPVIYSIFNRDFRRAFKKIIVDIFVCCETSRTCEKSTSRTPGDERRRSTRSSDAPPENNNSAVNAANQAAAAAVSTRLVLVNNNEHSCVLEEKEEPSDCGK